MWLVTDNRMIEEMVDTMPSIRQCSEPPSKRSAKRQAGKAYGHRQVRKD